MRKVGYVVDRKSTFSTDCPTSGDGFFDRLAVQRRRIYDDEVPMINREDLELIKFRGFMERQKAWSK